MKKRMVMVIRRRELRWRATGNILCGTNEVNNGFRLSTHLVFLSFLSLALVSFIFLDNRKPTLAHRFLLARLVSTAAHALLDRIALDHHISNSISLS